MKWKHECLNYLINQIMNNNNKNDQRGYLSLCLSIQHNTKPAHTHNPHSIRFNNRLAAPKPSRQIGPATTTVMIDVFEPIDHVRNTA